LRRRERDKKTRIIRIEEILGGLKALREQATGGLRLPPKAKAPDTAADVRDGKTRPAMDFEDETVDNWKEVQPRRKKETGTEKK